MELRNMPFVMQEGLTLTATTNSSLLWNGQQSIENRAATLVKSIQLYMKGKKEVSISELIENLNVSADVVIKALRILKDKGLIKEN